MNLRLSVPPKEDFENFNLAAGSSLGTDDNFFGGAGSLI
jgi:hypothetical protein